MTNVKRDLVSELHAPAGRYFRRRNVIIKGLTDLFQADLVEMIPYANENENHKYILTVINAFSKYAWVLRLKSKSGKEVAKAIEKIS